MVAEARAEAAEHGGVAHETAAMRGGRVMCIGTVGVRRVLELVRIDALRSI